MFFWKKKVSQLTSFFLGGDSAVKLFTKFGMLEVAIDNACDNR